MYNGQAQIMHNFSIAARWLLEITVGGLGYLQTFPLNDTKDCIPLKYIFKWQRKNVEEAQQVLHKSQVLHQKTYHNTAHSTSVVKSSKVNWIIAAVNALMHLNVLIFQYTE